MEHVYAVILAGGSGERFWPLSTKARPKQFISLFGGRPLLSLAVERLAGFVRADHIFIITAERLVEATAAAARNIPYSNILGEPCKRDTAPAIAVASGLIRHRDPEGVICILTADQLMTDEESFRMTLADAAKVASDSKAVVTIGIRPTYPATGFGYIEAGEPLDVNTVTLFSKAKQFVEKPDAETATAYVDSGRYFWNSGMFIWHSGVMRELFAKLAPDFAELSDRVMAAGDDMEAVKAVMREIYPGLRAISIDYAVMEHAPEIIMAQGAFGWDDVGAWTSLEKHFAADQDGNVIVGTCEAREAQNNIVVSENRLTALIGVRGLVVVQSDGATLICPKERAQEVKKLLHRIVERPDGEKFV